MIDLLQNRILWTAVAANLIAGAIKVLLILVTERRVALSRFLETGGMPSTHGATVAALATGVGLEVGWGGHPFALAAILCGIVIHDATGIRRAAGAQAGRLNELVRDLAHIFEHRREPGALKTLLGHTYPQVFVGVIIGIATALVFLP